MRRRVFMLVAGAVLTLSGVAAAQTGAPKVTVIGDSVADKMERNPVALASLSHGYTLDLQTSGCRRLAIQSCTIFGSSGPAPNVLQLVKSLAHRIGKIVVIDVGYNDTPSHYDHDLDAVMRALRDGGVRTVVWLTLRDPDHVYRATNKDIFREPNEWPELVIADWDRYSDQHPDWFESDGLHLTSLGAGKLGQFIHTVLHRVASHD
jgi:hypothetical protein